MKYRIIIITIACVMLFTQLFKGEKAEKATSINNVGDVIQSYKHLETKLWEELSRDNIWKTESEQDRLCEYLWAAAELKITSLTPILVKNISYQKWEKQYLYSMGNLHERMPAYGALVKIGFPAIPEIIKTMKSVTPEKSGKNAASKQASTMPSSSSVLYPDPLTLLNCLKEIFDKGGFGKEMVTLRIELEIKSSNGEEKDNLEKYLELLKNK